MSVSVAAPIGKAWKVTAEERAQKAEDQRERGRLDEALISAQGATALEPKSANAFWQLALCQLALNGATTALESLEKVTELAPHFGYGWTRLGFTLGDLGQDKRAKECFEKAIAVKPDERYALNELASIYERSKQSDDEMRTLLTLERQADLTSYQLNRLGILHHDKNDFISAIQYYRKVAVKDSGSAGFFNLGLVFNTPEVGRYADAVDAWRRALKREPGHDRAEKMVAGLLPKLSDLRLKVVALDVSLLDEGQHYRHYINPLQLLKLNMIEPNSLDPKFIQRAKKALLREVELEEGRVSWMPGLHMDVSAAIGLCDELDDKTKLNYHYHVLRNHALSAFMQCGDLRHFLPDELTSPLETIELIENDPDGFGAWLSPRFAAQFDLVLTKAIERRELAAVQCLVSGRRWVRPEDDDKCFEGAHRQANGLLEGLRAVAQQSENTKPILAGLQAVLSEDHINQILGTLPVAFFHQEKQEAATLLRSISIDAWNSHRDAELAKDILQLSNFFVSVSRSLQERIKEDLATLDSHIEEERKHEAHLRFGETDCAITRKGARFGSKFIPVSEVRAFRCGWVVTHIGNVGNVTYNMIIGSVQGDEIKIGWTAARNDEKQRDFFGKLFYAADQYLLPRIVTYIRQELNDNKYLRIGSLVLTKDGVIFTTQGWFTSRTIRCPWSRVKTEIENGELVVSDAENSKAIARLVLHEVDNAFALPLIAQNT